ncbi:MAG: hypothetical protein HQM14_20315 [SAR324 cluster bacterium]|nr:hypothetical protein [SAR324 cluster bacterium]
MRLPNAKDAIIPTEKLRDYCLSSQHAGGKHKALVFERLLGLSSDDAEWLREVIKNKILTEGAIEIKEDQYGKRYVVEFDLTTKQGQARLRSTWVVLTGEAYPRLTSCYIPKKRKG